MKISTPRLLTILTALTSISATTAAPSVPSTTELVNATATEVLDKRGVPSAPRFVVYWNRWLSGQNGPPDPSTFSGYNVVMLTFLLSSGTADQASAWASLSPSERASIKQRYNNAGIKLMVSAFGATDTPTSSGRDPTALAQSMASWVKEYGLDGIDVDYEDFNAVSAGTAANWLSTFTSVLRDNLPQGQYAISHAPIAPWFVSAGGGTYREVNNRVGNKIDFYNVQFYNQGDLYSTCNSLVSNSGGAYPGSSVLELAASGVDSSKIVIGKTASSANGYSGHMDASTLAGCVAQAKAKGWAGGVMGWQYPDADTNWIKTVRSQSWPT